MARANAPIPEQISSLTEAIVTVGEGRGFLVAPREGDAADVYVMVITAARCLPHLPGDESTYADLIGSIGARPSIWAEVVYADPVGIAALRAPIAPKLSDKWGAYEQFVKGRPAIGLDRVQDEPLPAWLYAITNVWEPCSASSSGSRWIKVDNAPAGAIAPGISGSPILNSDGRAVGIITIGDIANPQHASDLPNWLLSSWFKRKTKAARDD